MKKLLACLLVVILSFGMCLGSVSAATASPHANGIVSNISAIDSDNSVVSFNIKKIDSKVPSDFQAELKELKTEKKDDSLKVVAQYGTEVIGNPKFPVKVTLNVLGVSSSSKVYVMVKEKAVTTTSVKDNESKVITLSNAYDLKATTLAASNEIKVFETTVEDGKITFTLERNIETLAIVADKATATNVEKANNVTSPQTGDNSVIVTMIAILSLAFTLLVYKKVKA